MLVAYSWRSSIGALALEFIAALTKVVDQAHCLPAPFDAAQPEQAYHSSNASRKNNEPQPMRSPHSNRKLIPAAASRPVNQNGFWRDDLYGAGLRKGASA